MFCGLDGRLDPGHLEPDEDFDDQFYTLDKWYNPYGEEAMQDTPELFKWTCCGRTGEDKIGCKTSHHREKTKKVRLPSLRKTATYGSYSWFSLASTPVAVSRLPETNIARPTMIIAGGLITTKDVVDPLTRKNIVSHPSNLLSGNAVRKMVPNKACNFGKHLIGIFECVSKTKRSV